MSRKLPMFYSALLLTGVNLLLRLAGTSFQVYLSRRIGAVGIGLLQLTMSLGNLAMIAGIAGARTATMYLAAGELGKGRRGCPGRVLSGCLVYSLLCSGLVGLLLYSFAPALAQNWLGDRRTAWALRLLAAFLPVTCLCSVMTGFFTAAHRIGTLAAVEVAEQLCAMAATLAALQLFGGDDPALACLWVVLGSGVGSVVTLCCLVVLRISQGESLGRKIPVARPICRAALPLAAADILKAGISTAENLMVPRRLALCRDTLDPLASFGILSGMVFPVVMFPACILFGLSELLIPELARCAAAGSRERIQYLAKKTLFIALLYGLLWGGLLHLGAVPLCRRLYGSPEAGETLRRYALLIPMLYCDAVTDAMTKGLGQQTACVRYNIFTNALDVCLLFLLLPRFGMAGYFFSFLVTHAWNFALSLGRLLKITGVRLAPGKPLLALAAALVAVLAAGFGGWGWYPAMLLAGLWLTGVVGREEVAWARGLL